MDITIHNRKYLFLIIQMYFELIKIKSRDYLKIQVIIQQNSEICKIHALLSNTNLV